MQSFYWIVEYVFEINSTWKIITQDVFKYLKIQVKWTFCVFKTFVWFEFSEINLRLFSQRVSWWHLSKQFSIQGDFSPHFLLLLIFSVSSLILRYLLINPVACFAVVYLHLISHFHNFRVPFAFSKMYSDACIGINSRTKVTKSGFITDLLLLYQQPPTTKKHWKRVNTHFNTENTKLRETPKRVCKNNNFHYSYFNFETLEIPKCIFLFCNHCTSHLALLINAQPLQF